MKNRPLGLGTLLVLGFATAAVIRVCVAAKTAKVAKQEAARAEKARWENEGGAPATPAT